ncbi:MAG: zinc-dependent alcohol dehydrogenase family protein [Nitrososphaerota archaeon]
MLAAVYDGPRKITVKEYFLRPLEKNELLIKVAACGVCGTDKHIYEGSAPSSVPVILGHEYSGTITDKGSRDNKFKIGDKVAIDPNIQCGNCKYCRIGNVNFCENLKALGVTRDGGFAEYSIVPVSQAYILPNDFDLNHAVFAEPLSCCLRGIEHAAISSGNSVVIIGGGPIGLLMVQLVKNAGASRIILIEPDQQKQKLGVDLGADYCLSSVEENISEKINELTNSQVDVVIECVGNKDTVDQAIKLAGKGGKVVIFGLAPNDQYVTLNLQYLFHKELKIFNSFLNPFTIKPAIDLLIHKRINVQKLITKKVFLKNINEIFQENDFAHDIKVLIINSN